MAEVLTDQTLLAANQRIIASKILHSASAASTH
jgi:hypothetical protein